MTTRRTKLTDWIARVMRKSILRKVPFSFAIALAIALSATFVVYANGGPSESDVQITTTLQCDRWSVRFEAAQYEGWTLVSSGTVRVSGDWTSGNSQTVTAEFVYEMRGSETQVVIKPMIEIHRPPECDPTAPPSPPLPPSSPPSETGQTVIPMMWLLKDNNGRHCIIISDTHPSIERQQALCWTDFMPANAPCAEPVLSRYRGDELGSWYCDHYTPWRLPLSTLRKIA